MCQAQAIIYYCPISFQVEPSCEHSFAKSGDIKFERCTDYSGEYFSQCPDISSGEVVHRANSATSAAGPGS